LGSHNGLQVKYNRFASIGNVEEAHRDAFNKLRGRRDSARYFKGGASLSNSEARDLIDIVKEMIEDAKIKIRT
jgi:hypothetical protein